MDISNTSEVYLTSYGTAEEEPDREDSTDGSVLMLSGTEKMMWTMMNISL